MNKDVEIDAKVAKASSEAVAPEILVEKVEEALGKMKAEDKNDATELALDKSVERQVVPSLTLNKGLGGGFGYGRQVIVWGSKGASKTSFTLSTIAAAQKEGKVCAFIDAEKTFESSWAKALGVNTEALLYLKNNTIPEVTNVVCRMMKSGVDLIVVDSINALLPKTQLEDDGDLKPMGENNSIGSFSKDISEAMSRMNAANDNTLLILISQSRTKLGSYGAPQQMSGGNAAKFYSSQIVKLWSSESQNNAIKGKVYVGNHVIEDIVGREVAWTVEANKLGPMWVSGTYPFIFKGDNIGIDSVTEIAQLATTEGIVTKAGAWYKYGDESYHGNDALVEALREDKALFEEIREQVMNE